MIWKEFYTLSIMNQGNKILLLVQVAILALTWSCNRGILRFNLENTTRADLPAASNISQFISVAAGTEVHNSETFKKEGTSADKVKDVNLKALELNLVSPENEDFGFMTEVHVYISFSDGSAEQKIAWVTNIPETTGKQLILKTDEKLDLDTYIKSDQFRLTIKYKQRKVQLYDLEVDIVQKYRVTAAPL